MSQADDVEKYRPEITEMTILKAAQDWGAGNEIVSLNGRETALDSFVLVLATDGEALGPFLLNRSCARELYGLLEDAGVSRR